MLLDQVTCVKLLLLMCMCDSAWILKPESECHIEGVRMKRRPAAAGSHTSTPPVVVVVVVED